MGFGISNNIEKLHESEVDNLVAAIVSRIREHPLVTHGGSVRGTIAFKEVLLGFGQIKGSITRKSIEKAAMLTLSPRIAIRQGDNESASNIVSDIVREILYGSRFSRKKSEIVLSDGLNGLSLKDVKEAIQNIATAQLNQDQGQQLAQKEQAVIMHEDSYQRPSEYIASQSFVQDGREKRYPFSNETIKDSIGELERKLRLGEITEGEYRKEKTKLEEIMSAASYLQSQMSSKELAKTLMEFMDAKGGWRSGLDFQDIYTYYHAKGNYDGKQLNPPKWGWYGLSVVIDYLERREMLKTTRVGKGFNLTGAALDSLLEYMLPRAQRVGNLKGLIGNGKVNFSKHNSDIRRYTAGDIFRDISVRHTLREIAKEKKKLANISQRNLKVFMRQRRKLQSDIILCMDSSSSMGLGQKPICVMLVASGLARAALENGDRVGLVTFDDLRRTILPLTNKRKEILDYIVTTHASGSTNIGDGIECATQLLLREPSRNQKYIILITDGAACAISQKAFGQMKRTNKKDLSEECAILETRKASSRGVRISVVHITDGKDVDGEFVGNIAKLGRGQVRTIGTVEDIRFMAQ